MDRLAAAITPVGRPVHPTEAIGRHTREAPSEQSRAKEDHKPVRDPLLLVPLDDLRVADLCRIGVESCCLEGTPLPQQVPALVERYLERI